MRPAGERGHFNHGWLDTYHTFSFAEYFDPAHVQFGALRVINEDRVEGGAGFPTHGHRDMEILTYVLEGALEHKDSLGNGSIIRPGDVQRLSAGTGVRHSEFNPSKNETVHLLQIWILPAKEGTAPSYEQKSFSREQRMNRLLLVASPDAAEDSVKIGQDARVYAALLGEGKSVSHSVGKGRRAWVQAARGSFTVNGTRLAAGDGAAVEKESTLTIAAARPAEALVFDLP